MLEIVFDLSSAGSLKGAGLEAAALPLALSQGPVSEEGIGEQRAQVLRQQLRFFPFLPADSLEEDLLTARKGLARIFNAAHAGEPMRIWSGPAPDDCCGLHWLMAQLEPLGFENLRLRQAQLPPYLDRPDGTLVTYRGWAEMDPDLMTLVGAAAQKLSPTRMRMLAQRWKTLMAENGGLRALVNDRLMTVPESLYDGCILRRMAAMDPEFPEQNLIGAVLAMDQLPVSDSWIAGRVEQFIREGLLEPVTEAPSNRPTYHRILRKM